MDIILGTAQLSMPYGIANKIGKVDSKEIKKILEIAKANKINTFDTAMNYDQGEKILGKFSIKNYKIITKIPKYTGKISNIESWIEEKINQSLIKLRTKKIYCVLFHDSEQLFTNKGKILFNCLESIKKKGLIEKIGISIYSFNSLNLLIKSYNIDVVQCPFNVFDRRLIQKKWVSKLLKKNIEIHIRSIFLQGLLLIPPDNIPIQFAKWLPLFKKWHQWNIVNNVTPLESCIGFIKSYDKINKVIIGVDSSSHLDEFLKLYTSKIYLKTPDFSCKDDKLINPSLWKKK